MHYYFLAIYKFLQKSPIFALSLLCMVAVVQSEHIAAEEEADIAAQEIREDLATLGIVDGLRYADEVLIRFEAVQRKAGTAQIAASWYLVKAEALAAQGDIKAAMHALDEYLGRKLQRQPKEIRAAQENDAIMDRVDQMVQKLPADIRDRVWKCRLRLWELRAEDASVEQRSISDRMQKSGLDNTDLIAESLLAELQAARLKKRWDEAFALCDRYLDKYPVDKRKREIAYSLRLIVMEEAELRRDDILAWFIGQKDPIAEEIINKRRSRAEALIGTLATPLIGDQFLVRRRYDSRAEWHNKPVLVYFFASWSPSCLPINQLVNAALKKYPEIHALGVSLDTKDSVSNLGPYIQQQQLLFPVLCDEQGWEGAAHKAYEVSVIPHIVLIDAKGVIRAADIVVKDLDTTAQRLDDSLQVLLQQEKKDIEENNNEGAPP